MGLDISPGGAHWSYTGFHQFRSRLAQEYAIDLNQMKGFVAGGQPWPDDTALSIRPLLDHSDCEGIIESWWCEQMIPSLTLIREKWLAADPDDWDCGQLGLLIEGMTHCAEHGCAMVFH